ncbi:MAG: hypothetical protein RLZZ387_1691 [Chloroflexota bacterium]
MTLEIIRLLAFEGPNILGPQPSVLLQLRADRDRSARLRAALKDAAQSVGVVVGALDVAAADTAGGALITASFSTPTPVLSADVARYVVAGMRARAAGDESWDAEEELWQLQRRRRAEALPLEALRLAAEATARGVPWFVRADGALQLGYGARGWAVRLGALRGRGSAIPLDEVGVAQGGTTAPASIEVPWERIGAIPVVAVTGGAERGRVAGLVAAALRGRGVRVAWHRDAGFERARELLAEPGAEAVVAGLEPGDALRRGLPFERCTGAAVLGLPDPLPPEAADREEQARALGVALLLTDSAGTAALGADTPEVAALTAYAPCPVTMVRGDGAAEQAAGALLHSLSPAL